MAMQLLAGEATAVSVVTALAEVDVDSLLLKGASVERWLYGSEEWRLSSDVDLLVAPHRLAEAERCLKRLGFVNRYDGISPSWAEEHADSWRASGWPLPVDLHRRLWGCRAPELLVWRRLWDSRATLEMSGGQVYVLGEAARLLSLALHAAHHGGGAARPLADLQRAIERVEQRVWRETLALALALGADEGLAAGLGLVEGGAQMRAELGLRAADPDVVRVIARMWAEPPTAEGFVRLVESRGVRAKATLLARELIPSREFMRSRSARAPLARRGRRGLAAAYIVRLGDLMIETPKGLRAAWRLSVGRRR